MRTKRKTKQQRNEERGEDDEDIRRAKRRKLPLALTKDVLKSVGECKLKLDVGRPRRLSSTSSMQVETSPPSRIKVLHCLLEWLASLNETSNKTLVEWKKPPGDAPLTELFKGGEHVNRPFLLAVWVTLRHTSSRLELVSYQTNPSQTTLTTIVKNP
jgi:hypothetical protein